MNIGKTHITTCWMVRFRHHGPGFRMWLHASGLAVTGEAGMWKLLVEGFHLEGQRPPVEEEPDLEDSQQAEGAAPETELPVLAQDLGKSSCEPQRFRFTKVCSETVDVGISFRVNFGTYGSEIGPGLP